METLQRLAENTHSHVGPHTHTSCYYHTPGEVLLIFRVFCPSSSFGGSSWTIQLLPVNGVSQGSVGYLLYINKGNYQLNWESSVASSAMPFSAVLHTCELFWHALLKQCTDTARIKGFIYHWHTHGKAELLCLQQFSTNSQVKNNAKQHYTCIATLKKCLIFQLWADTVYYWFSR